MGFLHRFRKEQAPDFLINPPQTERDHAVNAAWEGFDPKDRNIIREEAARTADPDKVNSLIIASIGSIVDEGKEGPPTTSKTAVIQRMKEITDSSTHSGKNRQDIDYLMRRLMHPSNIAILTSLRSRIDNSQHWHEVIHGPTERERNIQRDAVIRYAVKEMIAGISAEFARDLEHPFLYISNIIDKTDQPADIARFNSTQVRIGAPGR